jgi:hypothetical protein
MPWVPEDIDHDLDPDWQHVDPDLRILVGLARPVRVVEADGTVTVGMLAVSPGLLGDAARADEGIEPFRDE